MEIVIIRNKWILALLLAAFLVLPNYVQAKEFTIVTNDLPPLKFVENGKLKGVGGELLAILMARTGHDLTSVQIEVMPFSEAYEATKTQQGTIFPCVAWTPERKSELKWVGPIYSTRFGFIADKSQGIRIESLKDAEKHKTSTVFKSAPDKLLMAKGFPPGMMHREATGSDAIKLLAEKKVDLFAFPQSPAYYVMLQEGVDPHKYEMVFELQTVDLYIGFNSNTDDALIRQLQSTLDKMKQPSANGKSEYDLIVSKYFAPWL